MANVPHIDLAKIVAMLDDAIRRHERREFVASMLLVFGVFCIFLRIWFASELPEVVAWACVLGFEIWMLLGVGQGASSQPLRAGRIAIRRNERMLEQIRIGKMSPWKPRKSRPGQNPQTTRTIPCSETRKRLRGPSSIF